MSRRTQAVAALLVLVAGIGGVWWWNGPRRAAAPVVTTGAEGVERLVPEGTRIRVEVLNTTTTRGMARRVTLYLRDAGFDVVRYAGEGPARDSTLILDRTGHPEWAQLASKALGGAPIELRPDSSGYVDITVLLGRVVRTPSQTFYP